MVAPPRKNDFEIYVSQLGVQEADYGDVEAATCRLEALENIPLLDILDDAVRLAEKLVEQKAIPEKASEDALHVALAAVHGMEYMLTWNCKHIANAALRANAEWVCRLNGFEPPIIWSPLELMEI